MKPKSNLVITVKENHSHKPATQTKKLKKQPLYKPPPETINEYLKNHPINFTIFFN